MKSWADVSASPEFQALSGVEQDKARGQYFDQVVAPQVPPDRIADVRKQFDADTRIAKKDLLPWIAPSDAGAGRGVQGGPDASVAPLELASAPGAERAPQIAAPVAQAPASAPARAPAARQAPAAPYVAPSVDQRARRDFAAIDERRTDLKPTDQTTSPLDSASPAVRDPMLLPAFVDRQRALYAAIPEADRLPILQEAAKRSDAQGRAAKVILQDVLAENAAASEAQRQRPLATSIMANTRQPAGAGQQGTVAMPDVTPTMGELAGNPGMPTNDRNPERVAAAVKLATGARAVASADNDPQAFADRADRLARDFDAEAFAKQNPHLAALASGGGNIVAGIVNSVPTVMDFAARLVNKNISRAPNAPGVDDWSRTAQSLMPAKGRQSMSEAWSKDEFAPWLVLNLTAQAPQMAGTFLAAVMPALRPVILPSMGLQTAGQSFQQGDSSIGAALKGGAEVLGEMLPLQYFDRAQAALGKLPPVSRAASSRTRIPDGRPKKRGWASGWSPCTTPSRR